MREGGLGALSLSLLFLFDCVSYMEERLALFRRIRERLTLVEECDVKPFSDPDGCWIGRCVDS